MAPKKEPIHKFGLARIKVAIWENQSKTGKTWFNVEIVRAYWAGDKWKGSNKFGRDDLPIVAKVADMAYAWIWEHEHSKSDSVQVDE